MAYRRGWLVWVAIIFVVIAAGKLINSARQEREAQQRTYGQFLDAVEQGKVESLRVMKRTNELVVSLSGSEADLRVEGPADGEVLSTDLREHLPDGRRLDIEYLEPPWWHDALRYLAIALLILLPVTFLYLAVVRQMNAGNSQAMAFARSRARRMSEAMPRKTFDDVAGVDEAKEELSEIVDFLRNADRYRKLGAEIPKGVLLMGPPGCGKTLLARAVAGEAQVPFFHLSGSDFVEMFVGVGASRVRDLFEQAKASRPCIVFIDELDAVGRQRGAGLGGGHDEREQTVNQLLVEMDGFEPNIGIIVMAATNRPDILDPALLRPGRFDRRVVVDAPDVRGRRQILELYLKAKPIDPTNVDIDVLARQTPGLTGADLYSVVNEAGIMAARLNREQITMADLEEAIERVQAGRERRSRVLTPSERRVVAYHEAGHALAAHYLPHCTPPHKVTILPRGMALGYVMTLPDEERYNRSLVELNAMMAFALAGRASEELVFGPDHITTGAQNDLERVTDLARGMICEYGMSDEIGPRTLGRRSGPVFLGRDLAEDRNYSEHMAQRIDEEIRRLVDDAYGTAKRLLQGHRGEMDALVGLLLERETISGDELREVLGPAPPKVGHAAEERPAAEPAPADQAPADAAAAGA